jgi:hypothetical protein
MLPSLASPAAGRERHGLERRLAVVFELTHHRVWAYTPLLDLGCNVEDKVDDIFVLVTLEQSQPEMPRVDASPMRAYPTWLRFTANSSSTRDDMHAGRQPQPSQAQCGSSVSDHF